MTLEEMLALLPDNTTGAIQAVDLRTIVTELHGLASDSANAEAIAELGNELTALGLELAELQGDVEAVASAVASVAEDLGALGAELEVVKGSVTTVDNRVTALASQVTALGGTVTSQGNAIASHGTAITANTSAIGLLQSDVEALKLESDDQPFVAQTFSYLWATSAGPAVGKVTADVWSMSAKKIQMNETTDDGQSLSFQLFDNGHNRQVRILTQDGKRMVADVNVATIDQGAYRDITIVPLSVTGAAPTLNQKVTVAVMMNLAAP